MLASSLIEIKGNSILVFKISGVECSPLIVKRRKRLRERSMREMILNHKERRETLE